MDREVPIAALLEILTPITAAAPFSRSRETQHYYAHGCDDLPQEPFVVSHEQLRLQLTQGIERNSYNN